ncbi:hypothetical protein DYD21_10460 [Rhodohalobacter sp. SW132]|uniref:hypothetical protein n=1 Tax=Rhodohalobacter sp. SW132 TaxID=2293433 RepID=UPI000E24BAAD|nr:hypothetical protein [Rhodohalobacter sp. SW132]REL33818.1 hypothetical protein DYD21_10460 [Rhodohalobacter sp. SW132]
MKKDFTVSIYKKLLISFIEVGYGFQTYREFTEQPEKKVILLRHDVDARKEHSLQFAKIQHENGIQGTYYFRMVPQSFDDGVIREIASMGHEIGYHYEDMDFAKGDVDKAYGLAKKHLAQLREVADVQTICMHGSPRSPYDNKEVWKKYDYRELGIIAEPYFDLDFSKVLYLTDTGRRWDGEGVSIRDKVPVTERLGEGESGRGSEGESGRESEHSTPNTKNSKLSLSKKYSFRSTKDIINACKSGKLPNQIMMNFHPQRWTDNPVLWTQELVWQNFKNIVKAGIVRFQGL